MDTEDEWAKIDERNAKHISEIPQEARRFVREAYIVVVQIARALARQGELFNESHDSDCQDRNRSVPEDYFRLAVGFTDLTSRFDTREATRIVEACAEAKQHGFWDELSRVKKRKPRKVGPKKSRKRVRK